jgi:hypothetical protein
MRMAELRRLREQVKKADARRLKLEGSDLTITQAARPSPFRSPD